MTPYFRHILAPVSVKFSVVGFVETGSIKSILRFAVTLSSSAVLFGKNFLVHM